MSTAPALPATPASDPATLAAARVLALSARTPRAALRLARHTLANARALPPESRARLTRAYGHALRAVGDYATARRAYRASRRIFDRLGDRDEWALGAIGLVDACMYLGRVQEGVDAAEGARPVFVRRRDERRLAMLEANLGNLFRREERLESALMHYERSARLLERSGSPVERAMVDHNRANVLNQLGRRDESEALFHRARKVFEQSDHKLLAAQTRYGIACLRFLSGEYAAAIGELEQVRADLRNLGARPLLALVDLDLAEVLLSIRLLPEALALARSAGRWFAARGVPNEQARCLLTAGAALSQLHQPRAAGQALDAADRLFRGQRQLPGSAAVALVRASLALQRGDSLAAARLGRTAYQTFVRAGFALRALTAGALTVEALLSAGRVEAARNLARLLRRAKPHPGDAYSRARLARVEGAAAARQGDLCSALEHYREAIDEASRARSALFVDEWRVGFLDGEPALLDEALGLVLRRRPAPRPAQIWHWLAAAGELAHAGAKASPPSMGADLRRRTAALRRELSACYARLWHQQAHGARRMEPAATVTLERRALRLEGQLRRLALPPAVPRREPAPLGVPTLEAGTVHLHYFSAAGQLAVIRRDVRGDTLVRDLASLDEVARLVRLFHHQMEVLSNPASAFREHRAVAIERANQHLTALAARLLDPVLERGQAPDVLRVTPYGPLFRVPFHALTWRGAPLGDSCRIALRSHRPAGPGLAADTRRGALVLGCTGAGPRAIEEEVRDVAQLLVAGGVATRAHAGTEATRGAIDAAAGQVALLHLAGHAVYRSQHPEFSALRLHEGWLHARDCTEIALDGACVVLSACETGPRGAVGGDEMLGLARGIEQAGARTVLASLWRVDDRETRIFMRVLYTEWRRLGRLGAALQQVQRATRARVGDPYLWAPFCLMGDPEVAWPEPGVQKLVLQPR